MNALRSAIAFVRGDLLPPLSIRRRLARATFWSAASTLFSQGGSLIGSVAIGRILGQSAFGQLSIVRSTLLFLGVLAGAGIGTAATKYVAQFRETDPARALALLRLILRMAITISSVVTIAAAVGAKVVATNALHQPALLLPLCIGSLFVLLNTVAGVQIGALAGFENFAAIARISAVDGLLNIILPVAGAKQSGVVGCTAGLVVAAAIGVVVKHLYLSRERQRLPQGGYSLGRREAMIAIWHFAVPAVVVGISVQPFDWLARVLLARQPSGFAQLGTFAAAFLWSQLVTMVPAQFVGPLLPIFANVYGSGDFAKFRRIVRVSTALCAAVAAAVAVPLAFVSPLIMTAYGKQFGPAYPVLLVLLLAYVLGSVTIVFRAILSAIGRMWTQVAYSLVFGATLIAVMFLAHRPDGAMRLAVAYLVAFVAQVIVQTTLTLRHLRTDEMARDSAAIVPQVGGTA